MALRIKLCAINSYVINEKLFGDVVASVRVVAFQKRGLTYTNFILFLDEQSKNFLRRPEEIYEIILAQLPSSQDR